MSPVGAARLQRRLAASYAVAEYVLPAWLTALRRSRPHLEVQLAVHNSREVMELVGRAEAEVGFVEGPGLEPGLASAAVGGDVLVVVVRPDHPWARRRGRLPLRELAATPRVTREAGWGTREMVEQALRAHVDALPPPLLELGSTTAVKTSVLDGVGPAVMSHLAVRSELADGRLVAVPVEGADLRRTFRAVWARRHISAPLPSNWSSTQDAKPI